MSRNSSVGPTSYNFTIDDSSPVWTYLPYSDGSPNGGWQTWFSTSGFNQQDGQEAVGDSRHITTSPGASIAMMFHGTAVYLYGNTTCPYDVVLDSQTISMQTPGTGEELLYSRTGLSSGKHFINLTARPGKGTHPLFFDYAIITDVVRGANASLVPLQIDNQNNTTLVYSGKWVTLHAPQIPNRASPKPYMETSTFSSSVSMAFNQAFAVAVNGPRNEGSSLYNVSLDGVETQYNASTWWLIGDTVLYYKSGLDPNKTHTLNITHEGNVGSAFSLNDITLYTTNSSTSTVPSNPANTTMSFPSGSHKDVGTTVGPVVAAFVILFGVIACALLIYRARNERKKKARKAGLIPGSILPFPPSRTPTMPSVQVSTVTTDVTSRTETSSLFVGTPSTLFFTNEKFHPSPSMPPPPTYVEFSAL
ncbi:hypothetical protein NLI96_g6503 [Meripilus lineatus]|uniref:Transmembrane protein n=1 Tax=Meripilus lineatus TaxID=2056292 RepID=A0AAD5V1G3_9APHY|nr:hypothetical protein NLI96_g6503 [Physisporinus lineatus]